MSDDELIQRYIDWTEYERADARLKPYGMHVWAIIGQSRVEHDDVSRVAHVYDIPTGAVDAALAYYRKHREYIDARLLLNSA